MINGKCRLCLEQKDLCKSHIIPEYFYKNVYDPDHKYYQVSSIKEKRNIRRRKGIYERLLCKDCEEIIKLYEDYGKEILYGAVRSEYEKDLNQAMVIVEVDERRLRLFLFSILWRASVSTDDMFSLVDLGPYEETIRKALHEAGTLPDEEYPVILMQGFVGNVLRGFFFQPARNRMKAKGKSMYTFIFDSFILFFGLGRSGFNWFEGGGCLREKNKLYVKKAKLTDVNGVADVAAEAFVHGKFNFFIKNQ